MAAGLHWWPRRCPRWSLNVFRDLKRIDNLLKHLPNIEKWMHHEKTQRLRVAEIPTAPNSRGGAQDKKNDRVNHPKKNKTISTRKQN